MATVVPEGPLPEPGQVVQLDLRPTCGYRQTAETVKLLQWNIERGYQLDTVIEQLRQADADILSLQEVDIGCQRSGRKDTGRLIAEALRLSYIFICEFVELFSDLRNARSQGGGVHGNAILSKYPITSYSIIEHSHHPIDWNALPESQPHPLAAQEPRRGRRLTLAADISTPQGLLRVYNCHLEVFCGILSRVWQFSDILLDARRHQQQASQAQQQQQTPQQQHSDNVERQKPVNQPDQRHIPLKARQQQHTQAQHGQQANAQQQGQLLQQVQHLQQQQYGAPVNHLCQPGSRSACCQAILGDLNTMAHGVARLSPNYCCDGLRWWSLGSSEAAWWQRNVFAVTDPCPANQYLLKQGLPLHVAQAAVNPGFFDPWDVQQVVTLDNPAYRLGPLHLMAGKLDWTLLRGMRVVRKFMGNMDYAASDHRWLLLEVVLRQ